MSQSSRTASSFWYELSAEQMRYCEVKVIASRSRGHFICGLFAAGGKCEPDDVSKAMNDADAHFICVKHEEISSEFSHGNSAPASRPWMS